MQYLKYFMWVLAVTVAAQSARAQTFTGNYNGDNTINIIGDNPAFAQTGDRGQVNLVSLGTNGGGNYLLFNRSAFGFLTDGLISPGTDYVKNPAAASRSMWLNMDLQGPGFSVSFKKKYAFAFTTGVRYLVNSNNLDNDVFTHLGVNTGMLRPTQDTYRINNFSFTSQVFREYDFSFATKVFETEDRHLSLGITAKLLAGAGAMGLTIPQASYTTTDNDGIAYNVNGKANFAFTPYANKYALTNSPLNALHNATNNMGLGFSAGAVYYLHINNTFSREKNYQARIALSVTDIGSISYSASSTSGSYLFNDAQIAYRNTTNNPNATFGNRVFNEYLMDTVARAQASASRFKVSLPTALHFNADINITREIFYLNANVLLNLVNPSSAKYTNYYVSTVTITPRYYISPDKDISFGMPFSYNSLKQGGLGGVAFVGPFYVGSRTLFNMFINNMYNNIDFYAGLSVRIKQKRQREKDYMMM